MPGHNYEGLATTKIFELHAREQGEDGEGWFEK